MTEISSEKESLLQEHIEEFKEYYRDNYKKAKQNVAKTYLVLFGSFVLAGLWFWLSLLYLGFNQDNFWGNIGKLILVLIAYVPIDWLYAKWGERLKKRWDYMAEKPILETHTLKIAGDLGLRDDLKILFKGQELKADSATKKNLTLHMPFSVPLVVCRGDLKGNKFYLTANGPELDVEVIWAE